MKYYDLTKEEEEMLKDLESGQLVPVEDEKKAIADAVLSAKHFNTKTKNINIRLAGKTLFKLKAKALHEGIPYQTLISSVLHKFASA